MQQDVIPLKPFANEYVGENVSVTLSQATAGGFNIDYNTVARGDSFVLTTAGVSSEPASSRCGSFNAAAPSGGGVNQNRHPGNGGFDLNTGGSWAAVHVVVKS